MKSYVYLKAEIEAIQQKMVGVVMKERIDTHKEAKCLCNLFGFNAGMSKGPFFEGRKNNDFFAGI